MFEEFNGVNDDVSKELEALFDMDEQQETSPTATDDTKPDSSVDQTKAFARRLKESTDKARNEERENIAKSLGFNSFEELQKSRDRKIYEEKGLDPDEISPIVDELVQKRINEDPRMKELEAFKKRQLEEFAKNEVAELSKLTDGEIAKLEDVPKDVLDLWKTKGSLKKAYIELKGEELIMKQKNKSNKSTVAHMNGLNGGAGSVVSQRHLTDDEKRIWKMFNPDMSDEEINKKLVDN